MNITGNNSIQNNIFNGGYSITFAPLDSGTAAWWTAQGINPSGITGTFVYFKSGSASIESGYLVGDLVSGNKTIVSGISSSSSSVSGYIYQRINTPIYGVCHGVGRDADVWFTGFNFYNAFHPEGTFSPPFGQNMTLVQENKDGRDALGENGSCSELTTDEYNDLFGIVSNTDSAVDASAEGLTANSQSFINSPAIACPQDLSVTFYWHENQYKIIGGTASAIAGNSFYNGNPIPTALDNFYQKTSSRYSATAEPLGTFLDNGDGTKTEQIKYHIKYGVDGKPLPAYSTSGGSNIFNSIICPGILAEGGVAIGKQQHSLLLNAPDTLAEPSKGAFDFFNWWNLWHFLYKQNSDGFPFANEYDNQDGNVGLQRTSNNSNHGSELFEAQLSNDQYYWDRRQCPEAVSFLPHTFGASIYACPSYFFDIPYYAAKKKFGFYGTRFLNGCVSLELEYPLSGHPTSINAVDLPFSPPFTYTTPDDSEPNPDKGTNGTFAAYTNLLRVASAEENQTDFYALNKEFFLWSNSGLINSSAEYSSLSGNPDFVVLFKNLFNKYNAFFPSGTGDFVKISSSLFESGSSSVFYNTGAIYDFLANNNDYQFFIDGINKSFKNQSEQISWASLESKYGKAVLSSLGNVASDFYHQLETGKQSRFKTRYMENFVKGNAVDLYPTNKIYFSYDRAGNLINGKGWGKNPNGFGSHMDISDSGINNRYFLGAYGNGEDISGFVDFSSNAGNLSTSSFYPGYFDSNVGTELPVPSYSPLITGSYSSGNGSFNPLGGSWVALGYNGVGKLDGNFSCFTPIFIQQPMNTVYCKIGQSPTFRALAVDYHTIPEDKINIRYPEIVYWTTKLKLVDSKYNNLYPLTYKWYRILKSDCSNDFKNFLLNPDFSKLSPSNSTGEWCAIEGDGPYCTLIHPTRCLPAFNPNPSWDFKYRNTPMYEMAQKNNFYMTHKQGAIKGTDDLYYYFCMTRGRFGIRISEPAELFIEDWLKFDVSIQNGGNVPLSPTIKFRASDKTISCGATSVVNYAGWALDKEAVPEDVVEEQLPPPNRGYGDVFSYKFVGMWGYRGAVQTYTPGTLNDTRGLKETWGRMLHYGSLVKYHKSLTQDEGDFLYGRNHLPVCKNHAMATKEDGIKVSIDGVVHWANMQNPIVDTDGRYGVKWDKIRNAGELYIPATSTANAGQVEISPGIGQWQWGNNLGTIHSFGWNSKQSDLTQTPYQLNSSDFQKLKKNVVPDGVLAGENCGWHKNGLGRNMVYWIEGFNAFYIYCDPLKKKNVANYNYMGPGLRQTNSSMQYFWLGKPNNSYLDRYPLFGPYAYHWKTRKHNRDRNGNGASEGFYSYGWGTNYTQENDAPAIYGLFSKYGHSSHNLPVLNNARLNVFGTDVRAVKSTRFGFTNGDGGAIHYGNIWLGDKNGPSNPTLDYVNSGEAIAQAPEFGLYGCSDADLAAGRCFDPCLSMRYQFGFLPGGKKQDMANNFPTNSGYRIVPNSMVIGGMVSNSTVASNGAYFRGAFGTPHLQYLKANAGHTLSSQELNGLSPCFDGGADHCNYITPTLNFGSSMYLESQSSNFLANANLATQSVNL